MAEKKNKKTVIKQNENLTFKVWLAHTFASYWFITAKDQNEAERKAFEKMSEKDFDAEAEASHIHDTVEVEEAI